jgi:hypothetical protein
MGTWDLPDGLYPLWVLAWSLRRLIQELEVFFEEAS